MLEALVEAKAVAVVRATERKRVLPAVEVLVEAGFKCIELTYTIPEVGPLIAEAVQAFPEAYLGAGTLLEGAQAVEAVAAGAKFLVSPGLVTEVGEVGRETGVPAILGAMTLSEVLVAQKAGSEVVKLFPAGRLGPGYVATVTGLLDKVKLMCTGGVKAENAQDFLASGAAILGFGSSVASAKVVDSGELGLLRERALAALAAVNGAL